MVRSLFQNLFQGLEPNSAERGLRKSQKNKESNIALEPSLRRPQRSASKRQIRLVKEYSGFLVDEFSAIGFAGQRRFFGRVVIVKLPQMKGLVSATMYSAFG